MNRFLLNLLPAAAAILVAAAALSSCEKGPGPEEQKAQQEQEKTEKTEQFWDVVGQLVAGSDITPDYKGKTFEPVIGVADASDPQARIVATNSAAAAARSFANLVGVESIDENTPGYTWTNPEVGTLTYTKMSGTAWAEVKVDIPSVPHLSKLIYRSAEQGDTNASFTGSAYYRFGDVIALMDEDSQIPEYWVCVRPAFSPEGKGETHWMSMDYLPPYNWWLYTSSHGKEYCFPTELKYSKEHMQNLAEMLFAICFPDKWADNVFNYSKVGLMGPSGLPIFHDFSSNKIEFHNAKFWNNVADAWRENDIDRLIMGRSLDEISREIEGAGLHFLYKGYSWVTSWTNYAKVYQARFVNTPGGVNANMQTKSPYTEPKALMVNDDPQKDVEFDVRNKKYVVNPAFFGDSSPRYIVRYATGAELSDTGKYTDVHHAIPGVWDVYRYYRDVVPVENMADHEPEITDTKIVNDYTHQNPSSFTGSAHYKTGDIYADENKDLWFVVNMSGTNNNSSDWCESSPYSELVSFRGLHRLLSARYVEDLPTYGQALRAILAMHNLLVNDVPQIFQTDGEMQNLGLSSAVVRFLTENALVDASRFFQFVRPYGLVDRNYTSMTGFAYSDPTGNAVGQPVGRFLYVNDISNLSPPRFFWKHYPSSPSATAESYSSFSGETIFLQDVADADKVAKYGPDLYATRGFHPAQGSEADRPYRTQPDPSAEYPEKYFYNFNAWQDYRFPTDMWNEPVLMFRADAVYDRGDEYATKTVNGHTLTLVKEFPLDYAVPETASAYRRKEVIAQTVSSLYDFKATIWLDRANIHVDGQPSSYPSWMSVWTTR